MLAVLAAVAAVLLDAHPVRVILLVFHGRVIASFAIVARHGDDDPVIFFSHGASSLAIFVLRLRAAFSQALHPEAETFFQMNQKKIRE